jgi:hypothetical protein
MAIESNIDRVRRLLSIMEFGGAVSPTVLDMALRELDRPIQQVPALGCATGV